MAVQLQALGSSLCLRLGDHRGKSPIGGFDFGFDLIDAARKPREFLHSDHVELSFVAVSDAEACRKRLVAACRTVIGNEDLPIDHGVSPNSSAFDRQRIRSGRSAVLAK